MSALDFVLKPVTYETFAFKMARAIAAANKFGRQDEVIKTDSGFVRVDVADICYIEVAQHKLRYHMPSGVLEAWGIMAKAEEEFTPYGFVRCNVSYLVNPRHVAEIRGNYARVAGNDLKISRSYKKEFLQKMMLYYSQGGRAPQ